MLLGFSEPPAQAADNLRLEWIIQGQFAGELVALDKGYYKAAGADIQLLPAGSDIKPAVTVAQGSDSFGIGHPNQVVMARSHGAPLVMVTQEGQKSAQVYIARVDSGIKKLEDVRGKKVGSWFGGDEAEFLAMLHTKGMTADDLQFQPEQDNPVPQLLSGALDAVEAVRYAPADLQPLFDKFKPDQLTMLYPEDYGVAIVNTGIFTSEKMIKERPADGPGRGRRHDPRLEGSVGGSGSRRQNRGQIQRRAESRGSGRDDQGDGRHVLCRPDARRQVRHVDA